MAKQAMAKQAQVALADKSTADILNNFLDSTLLDASVEREARREVLLNGLERTLAYVPTTAEVDEKSRAITGFVTEYFSLMIRDQYPQISSELLNLSRTVRVKGRVNDNRDTWGDVEMPVFVAGVFGKENKWERTYKLQDDRYRTVEATISTAMPQPTLEVREKAKEALAFCHDLESRALQEPVISDLMIAHRHDPKFVPTPSNAELYVLWKPKPAEINMTVKVIDRDPILMLWWKQRSFLVTTWDASNEEPYQHFLDEFKL